MSNAVPGQGSRNTCQGMQALEVGDRRFSALMYGISQDNEWRPAPRAPGTVWNRIVSAENSVNMITHREFDLVQSLIDAGHDSLRPCHVRYLSEGATLSFRLHAGVWRPVHRAWHESAYPPGGC